MEHLYELRCAVSLIPGTRTVLSVPMIAFDFIAACQKKQPWNSM